MTTLQDKVKISLGSGALLWALNTTFAYQLTGNHVGGCPTLMGRFIHLLVFMVITYFTMPKDKENKKKMKHSWYGFLIAFLVFSPQIVTLVDQTFRSAPGGCLTSMGNIIHVGIYVAILVGVMYL